MPHIFAVQFEIPAEHEAEFNRVYDTEHFPTLSKVPGVRSAARYRLEHSTVPGMQRYLTVYELDSPDVLKSAAWEKAGAYGDWATKIRPLLTSRITASLNASRDGGFAVSGIAARSLGTCRRMAPVASLRRAVNEVPTDTSSSAPSVRSQSKIASI